MLLHDDNCPVRRHIPRRSRSRNGDGGASREQSLLLEGSPFASEAGLRLVSSEEARSVVTLPVHRGAGSGDAHPGAITALVEAAAAAAAGDLVRQHDLTQRGISVNFVRPLSEHPLVAEARMLGSEGALRTCEVEVSDWNGTLVAKGLVTYAAGANGTGPAQAGA